MTQLKDLASLDSAVRQAVADVTISDIHTHLFSPSHGKLLLWGVDEMLTYHYMVAELFTMNPGDLTIEAFWKLPKRAQADLVWEHVFLKHGALSEACRGVVTTLNVLGLDVAGRDLAGIRKWVDAQNVDDYLAKVFGIANLDYAVMTNNPFKPEEVACWDKDLPVPVSLKTALRIDDLLVNWPAAAKVMRQAGYKTTAKCDPAARKEAKRFILDWVSRIEPVYMAASLGPDFGYPSDSDSAKVLDDVLIPVAIERSLPIALMMGVKKRMNPALGDGGDGVGVADVDAAANLCATYGDAKFICTMLSRVNQHELCVAARKFGNLHVEGCWWFCNSPSIIDEMTRMRLEMLGTAFTCQHSDARVLDQLIYKWAHMREIVANVLAEKFADLFTAGWRPTPDEVTRDIRAIFGGSFEAFLAK
ncbi:hypothetical protein LCGC14_0226260 [marine sediment metagenome]|uniref:Glucuronate isomerase n=1 Tax=marine sediment metagenome TaxID=412755 RepID=A0A0F9XFQ4_9ZZZZ|nr:glucuronate isomerase [Phycisphaerae bacterium]HDZ44055.1 glucuronate isomerase [Phycisphaerae bacterium]